MDERGQVASGIERRMNRAYFQSIKIENLQELVAHMCAQASLVTVLTKVGDKHFSFFLWQFWTKGFFFIRYWLLYLPRQCVKEFFKYFFMLSYSFFTGDIGISIFEHLDGDSCFLPKTKIIFL